MIRRTSITRFAAAFLTLSVPLLCSGGSAKAADFSRQVHQMLVLVAESIGMDAGGTVRPQDADDMIRHTFNAMDADGDGRVTPDEFQAFSMGFGYLAQVHEKLPQFRPAKAATFRHWNVDNAGFLTAPGHRAGVLGSFTRAPSRGGVSDLKLSLDQLKGADYIRQLTAAVQ